MCHGIRGKMQETCVFSLCAVYLPIPAYNIQKFARLQERELLRNPKNWRQEEGTNSEENGD
jgi:hypothetical protein